MVTITFDPEQTNPAKLAQVITELGYEVAQVPIEEPAKQGFKSRPAPLPDDAPEAFASAFRAARAAGRPMLIDFGATWCAPCVRLKKETLTHPEVVKALAGIDLIFVDLDEAPKLAKAYAVNSVPDLFYVDAEGNIVGRLREFEGPQPFLKRLEGWRAPKRAALGVSTSIPTEEVAKALDLVHRVRIHGRRIDEVQAGSAAAVAGLRVGDVLLKLGSNDLYSSDDIADLLSVSAPGDKLTALFKRAGEASELEVVLTLTGQPAAAHDSPTLGWQYSGLGQLPWALEAARAQKKKVMVGLSGAET